MFIFDTAYFWETDMAKAVVGAVLLVVLVCASPAAEPSAVDVLKASGVQGGLVVHVGCGNGKLTAALRTGDSFIVHGLDADAKAAKPNIVVIVADDLGYADVLFNPRHPKEVTTPHLDLLA
jgi:hypothetical protein